MGLFVPLQPSLKQSSHKILLIFFSTQMNRSTTRSLCDIPKCSPLLATTSHKGWNAASLRSNSIINPISIYLINSISFDLVEIPAGWIHSGTLTPEITEYLPPHSYQKHSSLDYYMQMDNMDCTNNWNVH